MRDPILFTDDDDETLNLYRMLMTRARLPALFTSNGEDALYHCQTEPIALVVSDINKPYMNGLELLAALRENPDTQHIPLIFVTASFSIYRTRVELGFPYDAHDYLQKPFDFNVLMEKINRFLAPVS